MLCADTATLTHVGTPIFVLEPGDDGLPVYSYVNPAWEASVGRAAAEVLGQTARQVFEGPVGEEILDHHSAGFLSLRPSAYDTTMTIGQHQHRVRTTLSPVCDGDGTVVQIVGTKIDHGEIARARELRADAQMVASEVEAFISLAAHDLRAPMRQVRLLTEMLREDYGPVDPGQAMILEKLAGVAIKSSEMITDILSHAQAVSARGDPGEFPLGAVVADILLTLDPLRRHTVESAELDLVTDRTVLQVVLRNLFDNAFKHSRTDSVSLTLDVVPVDDTTLEFVVEDNGDGFPDPALAFLDTGVLRPDSGFGLAGVRRLIRSRGGTISAENSESAGAVVRFTIRGALAGAEGRETRRLAS